MKNPSSSAVTSMAASIISSRGVKSFLTSAERQALTKTVAVSLRFFDLSTDETKRRIEEWRRRELLGLEEWKEIYRQWESSGVTETVVKRNKGGRGEEWGNRENEKEIRGDGRGGLGNSDGNMSTSSLFSNLYFDLFQFLCLGCPSLHPSPLRGFFAEIFSFSVPSPYAISSLAAMYPRVLEVGGGSGYWASLLRKGGSDVVAVDAQTELKDHKWAIDFGRWFEVRKAEGREILLKAKFAAVSGEEKELKKRREGDEEENQVRKKDTKGKVYSSFSSSFSSSYLESLHRRSLLYCWPRDLPGLDVYEGEEVIVVGPRELSILGKLSTDSSSFQLSAVLPLPQWPNINDAIWCFQRKREAVTIALHHSPWKSAREEKKGKNNDENGCTNMNRIDDGRNERRWCTPYAIIFTETGFSSNCKSSPSFFSSLCTDTRRTSFSSSSPSSPPFSESPHLSSSAASVTTTHSLSSTFSSVFSSITPNIPTESSATSSSSSPVRSNSQKLQMAEDILRSRWTSSSL